MMTEPGSSRTVHAALGAIIAILLVIVWAISGFWVFVGALLAGVVGWIVGKHFWE